MVIKMKRKPSFFRVLRGDFSKQLRIPPAFVKNLKEISIGKCILRSPTGDFWAVNVEQNSNGLCFGSGWQEFAKHHSLDFGEFLVFKYYEYPKTNGERKKLNDKKEGVLLNDPTGKSWPVNLSVGSDGRLTLKEGWPDFWKGNNIKGGDKLVFEIAHETAMQGPNQLLKSVQAFSPATTCHTLSLKTVVNSHIRHLAETAATQSKKPEFKIWIVATADMATSAVVTPATVSSVMVGSTCRTQKRVNKVVYLNGMNSYGGLKAHNKLVSLGVPVCTEQCFASFVSSLKTISQRGKRRGGGALSSTCDAASEIFRIAAIMNGLVLIGVAVGFVLLRIEAAFEESE